jgi:hypothetical protein
VHEPLWVTEKVAPPAEMVADRADDALFAAMS